MTPDFVRQMHRFILQHTMLEPGETVLVAVSGGADSLALLYGLHTLHPQLNCQLHVAHLNHSLRPDADADADFVGQHAARLGLPCTLQRADVPRFAKEWKCSVETAGRRARYQFYETVCADSGATKVALGHHQDDSAETVLMNLIRGSGATGLKGIAPVRALKFIRPLVGITRQQIEAFLTSLNLVPQADSTNTDTYYLRNRIRHDLIPRLERDYNPNIKAGLSRTADILGAESEYLDTITREAFKRCRIRATERNAAALPRNVVLNREKFRKYHIALQRRMLRQGAAEILGDRNELYFVHFQAMRNLIEGDAPNAVLALPNRLRFRRAYHQLIFEGSTAATEGFAYPLAVPGKTALTALKAEITAEVDNVQSPEGLALPDGKFEAIFDYEKLREAFAHPLSKQLPFTVRNRYPGDRFQPYGMQGTKKIKDFLIDAKVPREERERIPLLVCDDEILWLIGYTTSHPFQIGTATRQSLYLRYVNDDTSS